MMVVDPSTQTCGTNHFSEVSTAPPFGLTVEQGLECMVEIYKSNDIPWIPLIGIGKPGCGALSCGNHEPGAGDPTRVPAQRR
jgi:hypothetical protein